MSGFVFCIQSIFFSSLCALGSLSASLAVFLFLQKRSLIMRRLESTENFIKNSKLNNWINSNKFNRHTQYKDDLFFDRRYHLKKSLEFQLRCHKTNGKIFRYNCPAALRSCPLCSPLTLFFIVGRLVSVAFFIWFLFPSRPQSQCVSGC